MRVIRHFLILLLLIGANQADKQEKSDSLYFYVLSFQPPPPVMLALEFRGVCRYMFLNSATLIRPLPLKARVLGYEGARILGEKNVCNGVEHIPPPPNDGREKYN